MHLLATLLLLVVARGGGALARRAGQPPLLGQLAAGALPALAQALRRVNVGEAEMSALLQAPEAHQMG